MELTELSIQIALIAEDDSNVEDFKETISTHLPNAKIRTFCDLELALHSNELQHSTDICFIEAPLIEKISKEHLARLSELVSIYAFADEPSSYVLSSILEGYVSGCTEIKQLGVALAKHISLIESDTKHTLKERESSRFNEHFQSIADNMRSGLARVLDKKNGERELLFSNEGFYRLFEVEREPVEKDFTIILDMLHPDDWVLKIDEILIEIEKTGKAVNQYFRIITRKKQIKWIHLISNATRTDDGDILHDFIVTDITNQKRKEQFFEEISKVSVNGGWDLDLINDKLFWSDETKKIHEVPPNFQPDQESVLFFYVDNDSRYRVVEYFKKIKEIGEPFDDRFEITTAIGSKKWVRLKGEAESVEGKVVRVFGIFQDITEIVNHEQELQKSISEKSALLGEIHHRVKNNLAIISGLLQLELMKGANSRFSLEDAVNRIQSIATVHEILYSTENFIDIDIETYITKLVSNISRTYPKLLEAVSINCEIDQINLSINQAVPLGLLQNELITNSVKHAFNESEAGAIEIKIQKVDRQFMKMSYKDSGSGFEKQRLDSSNSLGFTLIQSLLQQLDGTFSIETSNGFNLSCTFPIEEVDHTLYA